MKFELVLPCYNEAKNLRAVVERGVAAACEAGFSAGEFNLVLVENGSKDDSRAVLSELKNDSNLSSWFRVVPIDVNQGYGFGIHSGLKTTTAPIVAWSHADQQCDPKNAFIALNLLKQCKGNTLVKGVRRGRSLPEKFVSRVFDLFAMVLLKTMLFEINAQPKVFPRELLSKLTNPPKDFAYDVYVLYQAKKNGYQIQSFTVDFPPRIHGFSNWAFSFKNRFKTILNIIKYMYHLDRGRE